MVIGMNINNENVKIYISKVNIVQDYIEENIDKELTIEGLSKIVNFSPFYFHRLFKYVTNESLYSYIKRLRFDKTLFLLKNHKDKSIVEIALAVGFSNQASFAKAFRNKFGVSASDYRKGKIGQMENNSGKVLNEFECYNDDTSTDPISIKIEDVVEKKLIYIRHTGYYKGDANKFLKNFIIFK